MSVREEIGTFFAAVVSGFKSKNARSKESAKLLTYGLTNYDLVSIANANEPFYEIKTWLGKESFVQVYTKENVYKTIKKAKKSLLKVSKSRKQKLK